jgi:thiamine pyrophosphate-dependent acetolactate synthase large subunit-like protein
MTRSEGIAHLVGRLPGRAFVASLGHPAYDLFAAGDCPEHFYTWGSMGIASSIALGVALAQPTRRVVALDGDGSLLMNLGTLATIGSLRPPNLLVVVWDNQVYGTTGGQPTATASGADLAAAARALGVDASVVTSLDALDQALDRLEQSPHTMVLVAKVAESVPAAKPPLDCVAIKQRFMAALGSPEAGTHGTSS